MADKDHKGEAVTVVLRDTPGDRGATWRVYERPLAIVEARQPGEVTAALRDVEEATACGLFAAGFVAYEAASGLDPAMVTHAARGVPLVWFGLFEGCRTCARLEEVVPVAGAPVPPSWRSALPFGEYAARVQRIKELIAAGDTYQVNLTYRLRAGHDGDPLQLFGALCGRYPPPYAAYMRFGTWALCSLSPELFLRRRGDEIVCRPMKGTMPRGRTTAEDRRMQQALRASAKDRAENVMIVDMVRNDLGRIAPAGSVRVSRLFDVEKYPTVWQMTSTVQARTTAPVHDVFRALFPSASVTGAPKIRTMEIIRDLEDAPRGVYTGAIGFAGPGGRMQFNVAIRTVWLDAAAGSAEYGVGGGVVWDSSVEREHEETVVKAAAVTRGMPDFSLLETLLWTPRGGCYLVDGHLERLASSAEYFDVPFEPGRILERLEAATASLSGGAHRVRLLLHPDGVVEIETAPVPTEDSRRAALRVSWAPEPVDPSSVFLYHKTTHRTLYDAARAGCPGADDVLLWNPDGEATEFTIGNLVVHAGGDWCTPPVECGLLPGVFRNELLKHGRVREKVLAKADVAGADALFLVNSVRRWVPVELVAPDSNPAPSRRHPGPGRNH